MKARVKWTKRGILKFIGHLDVQRYFHKAMLRANLPVSFTKGYSPHQIMAFAAPLGMGMTSEGEYADITFDSCLTSKEMLEKINAVMNEGIEVIEFKQIDDKEKNCMSETAACDYRVSIRDGYYVKDAFVKRTDAFYYQEEIRVVKRTKRTEKEVDISPLILEIHGEDRTETIFMKLVSGGAQNLKPHTVMEAFCNYLGYDYEPFAFEYHRLETYLEKDGELLPLGAVGWEITEPIAPKA